jgi:hypothetical protein
LVAKRFLPQKETDRIAVKHLIHPSAIARNLESNPKKAAIDAKRFVVTLAGILQGIRKGGR